MAVKSSQSDSEIFRLWQRAEPGEQTADCDAAHPLDPRGDTNIIGLSTTSQMLLSRLVKRTSPSSLLNRLMYDFRSVISGMICTGGNFRASSAHDGALATRIGGLSCGLHDHRCKALDLAKGADGPAGKGGSKEVMMRQALV